MISQTIPAITPLNTIAFEVEVHSDSGDTTGTIQLTFNEAWLECTE